MPYDPKIHNRQSIRLPEYDYTEAGFYFVTVCVQSKMNYFGEIIDEKIFLSGAGTGILNQWRDLSVRFPYVKLHEHVVMPNHLHGIIEILDHARRGEPCVRPDFGAASKQEGEHEVRPYGNGSGLGEHKVRPYGLARKQEGEHKVRPYGLTGKQEGEHEVRLYGAVSGSLGSIVQAFKSITTHDYIQGVKQLGWPPFPGKLWQRNYYEHIIRDEKGYTKISDYIVTNPERWEHDIENPKHTKVNEFYSWLDSYKSCLDSP
jgi:REP element-mobilizing transposase RayT